MMMIDDDDDVDVMTTTMDRTVIRLPVVSLNIMGCCIVDPCGHVFQIL